MEDNIHVQPLRELVVALGMGLVTDDQFTTPNADCAQYIVEHFQRGSAVRFLSITCGSARVMWSIGQTGHGTLHGDHPRGKNKLAQFIVAINATIDRSFSQP